MKNIIQELAATEKKAKVCRVFNANRSSLYYEKKERDMFTKEEIKSVKKVFAHSLNTYGRRRIQQVLPEITQYRISAIMKTLGLISKHGRPKKGKNVYSDGEKFVSDNLILGIKAEDMPVNVFTTDVSEFQTSEGKLYVSGIFSINKRVALNVAIYDHVPKAVDIVKEMEATFLKYEPPSIFHSDRGSQYISSAVKMYLEKHGIKQSMSRPHTPNDNQYIESFWHTMKTEIGKTKNLTKEQVRIIIGYYVYFYNNVRIHSALNYQCPNAFVTRQGKILLQAGNISSL